MSLKRVTSGPHPDPPPPIGQIGANYLLWAGEGESQKGQGKRVNAPPLALLNP